MVNSQPMNIPTPISKAVSDGALDLAPFSLCLAVISNAGATHHFYFSPWSTSMTSTVVSGGPARNGCKRFNTHFLFGKQIDLPFLLHHTILSPHAIQARSARRPVSQRVGQSLL
jgi:hypothetical protein